MVNDSPHRDALFSGRFLKGHFAAWSAFRAGKTSSRTRDTKPFFTLATKSERCQSVGTEKERQQAVALVAAYREQEAISEANDIDGMSNSFDILTRFSRNAAGGVEGEMMRRRISKADPEKCNEAQTKLAELRQEAKDLIAPVLRRVLVSYSEALAQAAIEAEARLEANGLPLRNGNSWTLHEDSICRALLSCKVKVEKALFELQPLSAVGACQFCLTTESSTPFNWP